MRNILASALTLVVAATAWSQAPYKVYTSPKLPARDSLERMNLTMAWKARVTVDGQRDGVYSVQVIPGKPAQLLVQTFKGMVFLFDGDSGDLVWKTQVGAPYWTPQAGGYNQENIFVTRRNILYVMNRQNGAQRVYTYDAPSKGINAGYELSFTPSAAPSADEDFLYVPMGNRVHAIFLPDFEKYERDKRVRDARKAAGLGKKEENKDEAKDEKGMVEDDEPDSLDSPQPLFYWGYSLADELTLSSPLVFGEQLSILTTSGTLTSINRFERGPRIENFEFKTTGKVAGAAGQHLHLAYLASDDFNLYAVNMKSGALAWRYVSGAPLKQQPYVNDRDIYISPERSGLRRIDRVEGREVWTNRDTNRFLAANLNNVYALDKIGDLFVLDARRGTKLAKLAMCDWNIPVSNEWTDRVYLAAHDGQVICLRHRELTKALNLKVSESAVVAPKPKEKKEPPMEEKKKEEDKDKEKEKDKDKDKDKDKADKLGRLAIPRAPVAVRARIEATPPAAIVRQGQARAMR